MSNREPSALPLPSSKAVGLAPPETNRPLTRRERNAVVARIHALMEYWGITVADLAADSSIIGPVKAQTSPTVKYRHPVTGETWDGQGPHPEWLRRALLHEGLRVDELKPD